MSKSRTVSRPCKAPAYTVGLLILQICRLGVSSSAEIHKSGGRQQRCRLNKVTPRNHHPSREQAALEPSSADFPQSLEKGGGGRLENRDTQYRQCLKTRVHTCGGSRGGVGAPMASVASTLASVGGSCSSTSSPGPCAAAASASRLSPATTHKQTVRAPFQLRQLQASKTCNIPPVT